MVLVEESFPLSVAGESPVDESGPYPFIRNVSLCGLTSEHGYDYAPSAWSDEALAQYEGAASYEGHKDGPRIPSEKVGWFEGIRRRPNGTPEAERYYLEPDHRLCRPLIRAAKHNPKVFSLSHRANVNFGTQNGRKVVESFGRIHSVDVVSKGGTTGGIFEHAPEGQAVSKTWTEYTTALAKKCDVGQLLKLKQLGVLVKEDGFGDAPMPDDAPPPDAADTDADDGITAAFKAAFDSIKDKLFSGEMDKKTAFKKFAAIFDGHGDATEAVGSDAADDPADLPGDVKEHGKDGKPKTSPPSDAIPFALIQECGNEGFDAKPLDYTILKSLSTPADRLTYIRRQKGYQNAKQPRSPGRGTGTVEEHGDGKPAKTSAELAADHMEALGRQLRGQVPAASRN